MVTEQKQIVFAIFSSTSELILDAICFLLFFRFCLSETSCPQEDHFPPNLCVKVNGKPCNLPVSPWCLFCFSLLVIEHFQCLIIWLWVTKFVVLFIGISSSHQKWSWTKKAQSPHQHNVSCPAVHYSPQHNCGVMDFRNWQGKNTGFSFFLWLNKWSAKLWGEQEPSVWPALLIISSFFQCFSMAVYLVRQQSSAVLLQRLRAKGIRNPDHSRALSKSRY